MTALRLIGWTATAVVVVASNDLAARAALEHTRGDGHATSPEDIRLFETGL